MRKDNFIYLLIALIIYLVALPILEDLQILPSSFIRPIAFSCLLAIGVWSLRDSVKTFRIGISLVIVGVISNGMGVANEATVFYYLSIITLLSFLVLSVRSVLRQILFAKDIDANRLYGAVCVYLMLGVIWALMYGTLEYLDPSAFSGSLSVGSEDGNLEWLYYSFITLTTLGYGDILPVSATARALAYSQAVVGVFYMAMLVAALVGSYAASRTDQD
jgi:hypothetical protein